VTDKIWLTVPQASEYANLSADTIYTACEKGELRHVKVGGRKAIRIRPEWVDAWLEHHARGGASAADSQVSIGSRRPTMRG
jgi:excisionase family DNA binding protein